MNKKKFHQLKLVCLGIIIGIISGIIVSVFRLIIQANLSWFHQAFQRAHHNWWWLLIILMINVAIVIIVGNLEKQEPAIKGSGIPQVEGQLRDEYHYHWWSVLWRKFIGGILAIGSGLFLGREGPSIQLGSTVGQGIAETLKVKKSDRKVLISSGAAAGLSAAFNAPLASVMFVLEEIFTNFSTNIWVVSLTSAVVADGVALKVFGLKPVLAMPSHSLAVGQLGWVVTLGIVLGLLGRLYQWATLNAAWIYRRFKHLPNQYWGIIPLILVIPVGFYVPNLLGGGSQIILQSANQVHIPALTTLFGVLLLRFIFSVFSYGSGIPGGIFLPMLCIGAITGEIVATVLVRANLISASLITSFIILGMVGFFAGVSKAPFTAVLLITEMVGSLTHLVSLALVSLVAYLVVDLLSGAPIYYSLLHQLLNKHLPGTKTIIISQSVFVGALADGKLMKDIAWPEHCLVTKVKRSEKEFAPTGSSQIHAGDLLTIEIQDADVSKARKTIMALIH